MRRAVQKVQIWVVAGLLCGNTALWSQSVPTGAGTPASSAPQLPGATPPDPGRRVPSLPGSKTSGETFRELLEMAPAERNQALADRTEHQRNYVEQRLREYENLPLAAREAKLKQLDFADHLSSLMRLPPEQRTARLELVSPELRPLVDDRLRQWDRLPHAMQQSVLEHETTQNYFLRVRPESTPAASGTEMLRPQAPAPGSEKASKWMEYITHFVELSPKAQRETLNAMPPEERAEMEGVLTTFAKMPPAQRKICLDSFDRFGRMSKDQRDQFLQNAARWQAMSPRERATWRELVTILAPHAPGASTLPGAGAGNGPQTASGSSSRPE